MLKAAKCLGACHVKNRVTRLIKQSYVIGDGVTLPLTGFEPIGLAIGVLIFRGFVFRVPVRPFPARQLTHHGTQLRCGTVERA